MCDIETLSQLPVSSEDLCYIICSPKHLNDILQVKRFDPTKPEKAKIDILYEKTVSVACKSIHRGFLWFKQMGLDEMRIVTYTSFGDEMYLEAIFTSGFLKLPVFVRAPSSTSFLILSPCEDFAYLDLQSAIENFNNMNFAHAKFIFENIQQKARFLRNIYIFKILSSICDFYLNWENFYYHEARAVLQRLLKDIELAEKEHKFMANIRISLIENQKFLDKLLMDSNNLSKLSLTLLLDILLNGKRLENLEKYNEATVRFYRVLEGCIQYRFLTKYGIDASVPNYRRLPVDENQLREKLDGRLPAHIAFNDGFKILCYIGDEFVENLNVKLVKSLQQIRNYSILVHGVRALTKKQCETARIFAEQALITLFNIYGTDYGDLSSKAKPCSLKLTLFLELLS